MPDVVEGTLADIDSWMKLVRRVRRSFPGLETEAAMDEHRNTVIRFMDQRRALCVKDKGEVIGVLLFSLKHNMICCLAVSPEHRRQGLGDALLTEALSRLDRNRPIIVSTFREEDEKGIAPRALYAKHGFTAGELTEEFGYPNQVFVLYP